MHGCEVRSCYQPPCFVRCFWRISTETPESSCLHDLVWHAGRTCLFKEAKVLFIQLFIHLCPYKMTERLFKEANEADKLQRLSMWELFSSFTSYTSSKVVGGADLPRWHYCRCFNFFYLLNLSTFHPQMAVLDVGYSKWANNCTTTFLVYFWCIPDTKGNPQSLHPV